MAARRICKRCEQEIPAERLEALPDTWLCVQCSQEVGGEFEVSFRQVQTNKKGSLKKKLRQHRNRETPEGDSAEAKRSLRGTETACLASGSLARENEGN